MRRLRVLTFALVLSGSLNIGLFTALLFTSFGKQILLTPQELKNPQLLEKIKKYSFAELVASLTYEKTRELALSLLVSYHDFDLKRALSCASLPSTSLLLPGGETLEIYPCMTEEEYEAIIQFAYQEKWPFTAKGLFRRLQLEPREVREASLEEAFFVTREFHAFQMLFQKSGVIIDNKLLLDLICEGSWEQLSLLTSHSSETFDFSSHRRQAVLFGYLAYGSKTAANLLEIDRAIVGTSVQAQNSEKPLLSVPKFREHVVKEGESLWRIGRKYQVKLEEIRQLNGLEKDLLHPGMTLLLPAE